MGTHRIKEHTQPKRPNRFQKFVKTPKGFVTVVLSIMALVSILAAKGIDEQALWNTLLAVCSGLVVDLVVGQFYTKKRFVSDGGVVTGLIVAMVLGSLTAWYLVVLTTVIALVSKHVLRTKRKPIFNPAAVGLLVSTSLFETMQSWWGGMSLLPTGYLIFLCVVGLWVTVRVRKVPQVAAFLVAYAFVALVFMASHGTRMDAVYALENPMLNSALFLAFFMLTDPPTSPGHRRDQIWFGALVGALSVVIYIAFPAELSYLFIALLIGNLAKWAQATWLKNRKGAQVRGHEADRTRQLKHSGL